MFHRSQKLVFDIATFVGGALICTSLLAQAPNQFVPQNAFPISTQQWSVTSPSIPDSPSHGALTDHSSMSPDSWSAPLTPSFPTPAQPVSSPNQFEMGMPHSNARPQLQNSSVNPSSVSPSSVGADSVGAKSLGSSLNSSPSIPNLSNTRIQSNAPGESPFKPSKYSKPGNTFAPSRQDTAGQIQLTDPSTPQIYNQDRYPLPGSNNGTQQNSIGAGSDQLQIDGQYFEAPRKIEPASPRASSLTGNSIISTPQQRNSMMPNATLEQSQTIQPQPRSYQYVTPPRSGFGWSDQPVQPTMMPRTFNSPTFNAPVPHQNTIFGVQPNYRPDLGHRSYQPTVRNRGTFDNGEKFDFEEKKKEYPKFGEILATGRYFGSGTMLYLQPSFQANTAATTLGPTSGESIAFDFDYEVAPQFRFGFESKYGPGLELKYMQYDESSNVTSFTSNGSVTGEVSTWMMGPSRWSRLAATAAGDRLDASHSIDVESISAMVFKEIKFPISRLNGSFGFQYTSIAQTLNATLMNGSTTLGRLTSNSDMRAYGPKFLFEYYRPVGHTKFEFVTSFGGSVLFGERDQFVQNTLSNQFSRVGADEFITTSEFYVGGQYKKMIAENRGYYARLGIVYQSWIGGGTAVDPQDDFGLRGFSFGVGYNR